MAYQTAPDTAREEDAMIFTLDGRGNVLLPLLFDTLSLIDDGCTDLIQDMCSALEDKLRRKGIAYAKLKSALIPAHKDKREAAFIFDSAAIEDPWYGNTVFELLLPALNRESTYSILAGDIIADGLPPRLCHDILFENIVEIHPSVFQHLSQYFVVYINHLSLSQQNAIVEAFRDQPYFTGYADMTFSSRLKTVLAYSLTYVGIKHQSVMILPHEEDRPDEEDANNCGYPFEENGFTVKSVNELYFTLFLSYKIEASYADPQDLSYSMSAICPHSAPVFTLPVFASDNKIVYHKENKSAIMEKLGLQDCSAEELSKLIQNRIRSGYFYNLEYLEAYHVPKFNLSMELAAADGRMRKVVAALKYSSDKQRLELLTMY